MIFLSCSGRKHGIKFGRLSGIVAHFIPKYLQKNRMPSWETNCIEDWETKIDAIVEETFDENITGTRNCKCILSVCNKRW
jgi:hypothetical protein